MFILVIVEYLEKREREIFEEKKTEKQKQKPKKLQINGRKCLIVY